MLVVSIMDLLDCRLMCFGVFQAVIGNQQARDNLAQVPSTSHLPWHVHLPSNETYDAQVCVYTVSQKRSHCNLAHNFAICWPISKFVHWHILCNFSYGILKLEKKLRNIHQASTAGLTRVQSRSIISETTCHIMLKFCMASSGCLANTLGKFHQILRCSSWKASENLLNWHGMCLVGR